MNKSTKSFVAGVAVGMVIHYMIVATRSPKPTS